MAGTEVATAYVSLVVSGDKVAPGVKKALGSTEAEADRAGQSAGRRYGAAFGKRLAAGAAIAGGLAIAKGVQFLGDSIGEAREAQVVGRRTENVIRSMGNASKISAKQVADLSGALSNKAGIDDEVIQSGANMLLTFGNIRNEVGKGNDIFTQTTGLMVDMSKAMGTDMQGAAVQLGKALNDPIKGVTALSRVGVSFTQQQKDQIKALVESGKTLEAQKVVLGEVKKQFGGAARAMSTPAERAQVAWGNLKEQIGTELLPVVNRFQRWLADKAIPAVSRFFAQMRSGKGAGGDVADVLRDVSSAARDGFKWGRKLVDALSDMPSWAIKGGLAGLASLYGLKKIKGLFGGGGGGSALGGIVRSAKPVPVFVTNMGKGGLGGAPVGGGPGGGKAPKGIGNKGWLAGIPLALPALGALGADMPKPDRVKAWNAELTKLTKSGGGQFLREVALRMHGVADASTVGASSVARYDAAQARAIQRDPAAAYRRLQQVAQRTGVSMDEMARVMPRTAAAIEKSGAKSKAAARNTNAWRETVLNARREVDKVDGKKPVVKWNNPGLLPGITNTGRLNRGIKDVDGKKPKAFFSLPGIMSRIAEAARLDSTLDRAARDRQSVITVTRRVIGGAPGVGDIFRAQGGPVTARSPYIVGERGPELFVPNHSGRIVPNHQLTAGLAAGQRLALVVDGHEFSAYVSSTADSRIGAHRHHAASRGR